MAPSVAIPTLDPLTVHAPEREAAERRAAEDAARAAHNVAIAAAVGDGGGGACFEIDKAASPMSRVRQKQLSTYSSTQGIQKKARPTLPWVKGSRLAVQNSFPSAWS